MNFVTAATVSGATSSGGTGTTLSEREPTSTTTSVGPNSSRLRSTSPEVLINAKSRTMIAFSTCASSGAAWSSWPSATRPRLRDPPQIALGRCVGERRLAAVGVSFRSSEMEGDATELQVACDDARRDATARTACAPTRRSGAETTIVPCSQKSARQARAIGVGGLPHAGQDRVSRERRPHDFFAVARRNCWPGS